uniref:Alba domain-containing protein n=1 Tax=Steinernema glaseri TaxID=37863 RepID=A0A1I8A4R7_9BILA
MEQPSSSAAEIVETIEICPAPFPEDFTKGTKTVFVKKHSKFEKLHGFAIAELENKETRRIIFRGYGEACEKCVSCVEVFKRKYLLGKLHQWTEIAFSKSSVVHPPEVDGAESKTIEKKVPTMFVLLSKDPFPEALRSDSMQTSEDVDVSLFDKVVKSEKKRQFDQARCFKRSKENVNKWRRQMKESKKNFAEKRGKPPAAKTEEKSEMES